MGACLGDDTIAALVEGGLGEAGAGAARAHLATCAACRGLVAGAVDAAGPAAVTVPAAPAETPDRPGIGTEAPASPSQGLDRAMPSVVVPGTVVAGKYRIEGPLGEGGMGRVFAARQIGLERPVAVKLLRPELAGDGLALARFHREARLVAQLMSDHVVRVHDLGELATGEPYLVMELLEGEDLGAVVARGLVATDQAVAWIVAACDAIAEAHALGIVHRDVKPSNLFITRNGRLKVLDFGLAKLATPPGASRATMATGAGVLLGSPHYMAPEQIIGARDVDPRADVWSIGATLYHLVTGRPPFALVGVDAVFMAILGGEPPSMAGIRGDVAVVIQRAMARDPAQRYANAGELAAALRGQVRAAPPVRPEKPRSPVLAIVVLLGALLAGVGAMLAIWQPWETGPRASDLGPRVPAAMAVAADATPIDPPEARGPRPEAPSGVALGHLDPTRLRIRLEKLGWTVTLSDHNFFPSCEHSRFMIDKAPIKNADVYLLQCNAPQRAAGEAARLRKAFRQAWTIVDGSNALVVMMPDEAASKQLAEALLTP
jgi:hypothetical protein